MPYLPQQTVPPPLTPEEEAAMLAAAEAPPPEAVPPPPAEPAGYRPPDAYETAPAPAPAPLVEAGTPAPPTQTVEYPTAGPQGNVTQPYDYGTQVPASEPAPAPEVDTRFVPGPPRNYVPGSTYVPAYIYQGARGENVYTYPTQGAVPPVDPETTPIHPGGVPGSGYYRWGGFERPTPHRGWTPSGGSWPFWDLPPVPSPGLGAGGPASAPRNFVPGSTYVPAEAPPLTTTTPNAHPREIALAQPHGSPRDAIARAFGTTLSPSLIGEPEAAPTLPRPRAEVLAAMERGRRARTLRVLAGLFGGGPPG